MSEAGEGKPLEVDGKSSERRAEPRISRRRLLAIGAGLGLAGGLKALGIGGSSGSKDIQIGPPSPIPTFRPDSTSKPEVMPTVPPPTLRPETNEGREAPTPTMPPSSMPIPSPATRFSVVLPVESQITETMFSYSSFGKLVGYSSIQMSFLYAIILMFLIWVLIKIKLNYSRSGQ